MRLYSSMMTVNSNYVFFIILLIVIVQLTRFNLFSGRNDKFEESPVGQLMFEKEKYVVPILIFGPNNQIQGLRESLFIAETLGRKLILPPFFEHYTSDTSRGILSADAMLDTSILENQFEVIDAQHNIKDICSDKIELLVDFSEYDHENYRNKSLEWLGIGTDQTKARRIPFMEKNKGLSDFTLSLEDAMTSSQDEKCILLENPFYLINWEKFADEVKEKDSSVYELGKQIVRATKRPVKLQQDAKDLLKGLGILRYAALHWRYDLEDFVKRRKSYTDKINMIKEIRENPYSFCRSLKKILEEQKISVLFIFSPPSDQEFALTLRESLYPLKVITDDEILKYMKKHGFEELLPFEYSLLCQELTFLSNSFFYSIMSSWSRNVVVERAVEGRNSNYPNLDLVIKQEETLPQELSAEFLRSSPTLDESALDQQIKNRFDKRVEIMKRACSVLPELERLAQSESTNFEDLLDFHRHVHETTTDLAAYKKKDECTTNLNRKSHVFDVSEPLDLLICLPPKCGTTNWQKSMSTVYLQNKGEFSPKKLLGHSMYNILPRVDLIELKKATDARSSIFKENRFRIANVRNPFARLYSAWGDKQRTESSYLQYWRGIRPFQEALGAPPEGMNNSFTAFAQYVAANPGNSKMNFHWTSTFSQCHPCAIDYNMITHLEHSADESDYIMAMLGVGESAKLRDRYAWSPATADELKWQSVPRGTAKNIYKHYYLDFVLFGYSPDDVMKFINATDKSKNAASFDQEESSRGSFRNLLDNFKQKYTDVVCSVNYFGINYME